MTRTEYLFSNPASKYAHLQEPLAAIKIADAKEVLAECMELIDYSGSEESREAGSRRDEVLEAIKHWTKVLDKEI